MSPRRDTSYTCRTEYNFAPLSGWEGPRTSYRLPAETTEDRTLLLNPLEHLRLLEVEVTPNELDSELVRFTEVLLDYQDPGGWQSRRRLVVRPDSPPQSWKLRLDPTMTRAYTWRLIHHLTDGTTSETEPVVSTTPAVLVNDPFPAALNLEVLPLFDPGRYKAAFCDLFYRDQGHAYSWERRLRFGPDALDPVSVRIPLLDRTRRSYSYQLTFVGTDNRLERGPTTQTEETILGVQPGSPGGAP